MSCKQEQMSNMSSKHNKSAADFLGNPDYKAMSYGGYRTNTRDDQPSIAQIKEDLKILSAMGVKVIRTYNLQLPHAPNILEAIKILKSEDPNFEMYVMLGVWIECENARLNPNHNAQDVEKNNAEIQRAINYANRYADIVKIIAVGNEAMVHWQTDYFVLPSVILHWVKVLQDLKKNAQLPKNLWITSSDNFASWGGGDGAYHRADLNALIAAVDYISIHTYPFHDTHYNSKFWINSQRGKEHQSPKKRMESAVDYSVDYAKSQYNAVKQYVANLGIEKPIHIGETGWASVSSDYYGSSGTHAADEYKQALYYQKISAWTQSQNIACFFFEAFDESWKDAEHPNGSENHFGLIRTDGKVKYALWDSFDTGAFDGLLRDGKPLQKTFNGAYENMFSTVKLPNKPHE